MTSMDHGSDQPFFARLDGVTTGLLAHIFDGAERPAFDAETAALAEMVLATHSAEFHYFANDRTNPATVRLKGVLDDVIGRMAAPDCVELDGRYEGLPEIVGALAAPGVFDLREAHGIRISGPQA